VWNIHNTFTACEWRVSNAFEDMQMSRDGSHRDANRDPITGEPGSHPVGVGVGGVAGGAAAGALAGTLFGPIGTLIGAAAGTLAGAAAGKGVAERIDPTGEVEYWREAAPLRPYYTDEYDFQRDYAGVYQAGAVARGEYPTESWEDAERRLQANWDENRGESRLDWDNARPAAQDAWERADRTYDAYARSDDTHALRFENAAYREEGDEFDDYRPAYRYGTYARRQYTDREWDDSLASDLERGWDRFKGTSRLGWERAKHAVADAFTLDRQSPH
jgi:hypothetical protein